jgi:hypothetical protein
MVTAHARLARQIQLSRELERLLRSVRGTERACGVHRRRRTRRLVAASGRDGSNRSTLRESGDAYNENRDEHASH